MKSSLCIYCGCKVLRDFTRTFKADSSGYCVVTSDVNYTQTGT